VPDLLLCLARDLVDSAELFERLSEPAHADVNCANVGLSRPQGLHGRGQPLRYPRERRERSRAQIFLAVLLMHVGLTFILIRSSHLRAAGDITPAPLFVYFLSKVEESSDIITSDTDKQRGHSRIPPPKYQVRKVPEFSPPPDLPTGESNALSLQSIDWGAEAELVAPGIINEGEAGGHGHRDLSGPSSAQLERSLRPINTRSACQPPWKIPKKGLSVGRRQPRNDLFKDMRGCLDERLLDPLP
jgi:hypothetical protein